MKRKIPYRNQMSKTEFVAAVAGSQGLSKQAAHEAVDAVVTTLAQALIDGESLTLPGLGTFSLKERAARAGHNPVTGEILQIPAKRSVHFKAAVDLQKNIPQPQREHVRHGD